MTAPKRGPKSLPRKGTLQRFEYDRRRYGDIAAFVTKHITSDPKKSGRVERALEAAIKKFGYRDRTSVQRIVATFRPWNELWQKMAPRVTEFARTSSPALELIRSQFSESERAELSNVGFPFAFQLALERAELDEFRARALKRSGS